MRARAISRTALKYSSAAVRGLFEGLALVCYPPCCALCDCPLFGPDALRAGFCEDCRLAMPLFHEKDSLSVMLRFRRLSGPVQELHAAGRTTRGFWVASAGLYQDSLRDAIHLLKYRNRDDLGRPLASMMRPVFRRVLEEVCRYRSGSLIVPVPLHSSRERSRGFNQARLLASNLARRGHLLLARRNVLRRVRRTSPQSGRSQAERRGNVRNAFRVGKPAAIGGRDILLVDDVFTTGATLEACAAVLLEAGANEVAALTLARTPRR